MFGHAWAATVLDGVHKFAVESDGSEMIGT